MNARERRSYCVYVMGSLSGTLYIGFTGNLHKRVFEHRFHQREGFTDRYGAERLLYWASFDDAHKAIAREKQLKGWSRVRKIVLIELRNPQWLDLAREWYPWMEGNDAAKAAYRVFRMGPTSKSLCHAERRKIVFQTILRSRSIPIPL